MGRFLSFGVEAFIVWKVVCVAVQDVPVAMGAGDGDGFLCAGGTCGTMRQPLTERNRMISWKKRNLSGTILSMSIECMILCALSLTM